MKVEMVSLEKNPLLQRNEMEFEVKETKVVPSRKEVKEKIAALTGVNSKLVIVEKINPSFGEHIFRGFAKIYTSKEQLERIERKYVVAKHKEEEKKEEKPSDKKA